MGLLWRLCIFWLLGLASANTVHQLNCSETRLDACELTHVMITEYTNLEEYEFPEHQEIVFGNYPQSDDETIITTVTKELAEKLVNTQTIHMQNVSLMSFYLWEHLLHLDASYNYLSELMVHPGSMYNLKSLNLAHNRLQKVDFVSALYKIRDLDLSYNYIEKVDFSLLDNAKDLETLKLSNNRIRTIAMIAGDMLHLPRLATLMLNNNQLSILDASQWQFNVLQDLYLANNRLNYISMCEVQNSFSRLQTIYLDGNNWECTSLNATVHQLQQLGVKLVNFSEQANCTEAIHGVCCSS